VACVQAGTLLWLGYAAQAGARELIERVGDDALHYAHAFHAEPPRTLRVNGLALEIAVGSTHDPVSQVLQQYRSQCRLWSTRAIAPPVTPPSRAGRASDDDLRVADTTLHAQTADRGYVACLDPGSTSPGAAQLLQRARAFAADLDLSHLGQVLYVVAERKARTTTYVTVKSAGAMPLGAAFPLTGDAPGFDVAALPRPLGSRRVLSAWQEGSTPVFGVYESGSQEAKALLARYRAQLEAAGFRVRAAKRTSDAAMASTLIVRRADTTALLTASAGAQGRGLISVAPLL
jgi:hypothetical protein